MLLQMQMQRAVVISKVISDPKDVVMELSCSLVSSVVPYL